MTDEIKIDLPDYAKVCTSLDSWMEETWVFSTRWIVQLSNGETVWQDDGRPGLKEASAWVRLKNYCELFNLHITSMCLKFRNHTYGTVFENKEAYFFSKSLKASFKSAKTMDVLNIDYYLFGYKDGDKVHITKVTCPALTFEEQITRNYHDCLDNMIQGFKNDNKQ